MQNTYDASTQTNQVTALYADRALSLNLSKNATLADLADHLDCLGGHHNGTPTAVYMKFTMSFEPVMLHIGD